MNEQGCPYLRVSLGEGKMYEDGVEEVMSTCPGRKEGAMQMLLRKSMIVYRKFSRTFFTNWGNTLCKGHCCPENPFCMGPVWS